MRYPIVLLDIDGTLINSERLVIDSLAAALEELGYPPPDDALKETAMRSSSEEIFRSINEPNIPAAIDCITRHWLAMLDRAELYPDVPEVIQMLHAMGCTLGIVTSRMNFEVDNDRLLKPFLHLFSVRACVEHTTRHKPHPDPILHCLNTLNARPSDVLYIGDSPTDSASAHSAGVAFALATWGTRPGPAIPAQYILQKTKDIISLVQGNSLP